MSLISTLPLGLLLVVGLMWGMVRDQMTAAAAAAVAQERGAGTTSVPPYPILYEVSTRPWLYGLSQKYGRTIQKLTDIPMVEFENLKSLGVDIVWLMGVWSLGAYGMARSTDVSLRQGYGGILPSYQFADIIGSPYAVVSYVVNPQLGTDQDLIGLRAKLNSMGLKLGLDFVPNHAAVDAPEVSSQPSLFIQATQGSSPPFDPTAYLPSGIANGKDPYGSPWTDTAQWNYWNSATRQLMTKNLMKVASMADLIRCDMSMLLLNDVIAQTWGSQLASWGYSRPATEFWADAISAVKASHPSTLFLAEVYWGLEAKLQSLGFDFTYDKSPYDMLGQNHNTQLKQWLAQTPEQNYEHGAHFVENHDEPRAVAFFGSPQRAMAAAAVLFTLPGMRFNFDGQWQGFANRLEVHLRRATAEATNMQVQNWYAKFMQILSASDVFKRGNWTLLSAAGGQANDLFAWSWSYRDPKSMTLEKRLCVVNYSGDSPAGGIVVVPDAVAAGGSGDQLTITELFSGQSYQRSAGAMRTTGLTVVVDAWSAQIFQY